MLSIPVLIAALCGGMLAGFINTLAGSGSAITLPLLIFLGLPANEANGTNRVGILLQNLVGMARFRQAGQLNLDNGGPLILPTVLGSIIGALIAVDLDEQLMRYTIAAAMAVILVMVVINPKKWLHERQIPTHLKSPLTFAYFFAIGLYGGFIQAGVGIFLLVALVLRCGFTMVQGNAVKLMLVLVFTFPAMLLFAINGQINWYLGGLMAVGQSIGAWLAAHFASNSKQAPIWIRRLLIVVIIFSILKFSGLLNLIPGL